MIARWARYTRVAQWWHFLALPLAGVARDRDLAALPPALVACAAVLAFGYLLNAVADRAMDADPRKNPLVREAERSFAAPLALLALAALTTAATVSPLALLAAATSVASGWCYSEGPRWKSVPFAGTLLNVGNFAPLLYLGVRDAAGARALVPLTAAFAALLLQNQLLHEAADAVEDRRGGLRTTFAVLGPARSAAVSLACGLALCAAVASTAPPVALALCAPAALVAPIATLRARAPSAAARGRRWHRLTALAVGAALFAMTALGEHR